MGRYVVSGLNGIAVEVPAQAERPREPASPSPHVSVRSPEMAERMLRPRERAVTSALTDKYLAQVRALRGQQRAVEAQISALGKRLAKCQEVVKLLKQSNDSRAQVAMQSCTNIERQIAALIQQVKKIAARANAAADAAIVKGASREQTVVESSGAGVTQDGRIIPTGPNVSIDVVPGAGESVPATPAPGNEPQASAQDVSVSVSTGSAATGLLVLGGLGAAFWFAKKRGWL